MDSCTISGHDSASQCGNRLTKDVMNAIKARYLDRQASIFHTIV